MALAFGDIINASARVIDTSVDEVVRQKETDKAIVKALRQDYEKKPEVMGWIGEILKLAIAYLVLLKLIIQDQLRSI